MLQKGGKMRLVDADSLISLVQDATILSDGFKQVFVAIVNGEPTIEPEPQWIPCSERLPERNQICIVTDETRRCAYEYGLHDETYDTETGWTYLGHKIIAWMPLPDPYKGGREDG